MQAVWSWITVEDLQNGSENTCTEGSLGQNGFSTVVYIGRHILVLLCSLFRVNVNETIACWGLARFGGLALGTTLPIWSWLLAIFQLCVVIIICRRPTRNTSQHMLAAAHWSMALSHIDSIKSSTGQQNPHDAYTICFIPNSSVCCLTLRAAS